MANGEQNIERIFHNLSLELGNVSTALGAQGVAQIVPNFSGNPKEFSNWTTEIEKYAQIANMNDERKKMIAYQTSKGAVSGFIQRYLTSYPGNTFAQLRQELASRFGEISDAQHALTLLRSVKQKSGENIQLFAERLFLLADEAYHGANNAAIERQMTEIFIDGLKDEHLKLKLLRERPDTLNAAITSATLEQNLRKRVYQSGSHGHHYNVMSDMPQPMEVDHYRHRKCQKCRKFGHTAENCRSDGRHVNMVQTQRSPVRKDIDCWTCGRKGHIKRFCKENMKSGGFIVRQVYGNPRNKIYDKKQEN
jgi:hypothetical protein